MNISVKYSGQDYKLRINQDEVVSNIKMKLSEMIHIEANKIILKFKKKELNDNEYVQKYEIAENSTLIMTAKLKVSIKDMNIDILICPDDTVWDLKEQLSEKIGNKSECISLEYEGNVLDDESMLGVYKIKDNSILTMGMKIKLSVIFRNETHIIELKSNATVREVKELLSKTCNFDILKISLQHHEKILLDSENIKYYGIENESELKMILQVPLVVQFGGEIRNFYVIPDAAILDIKIKLSEMFTICAENINLTFNNKVLQDNGTLASYQIQENSKLVMSAKIRILIKSVNNEFYIDMCSDATICDLKKEISKTNNIAEDKMVLIHNEELLDENTLDTYKIGNNSRLILKRKVKIFVNCGDEIFTVDILLEDTVSELKKKLSEKIGILSNNITLRFEKIYLKESKTLNMVGLENESKLLMTIKIKLSIEYGSQSHQFDVSSDSPVSSIISKVSDTIGIGRESISLWFRDKELIEKDQVCKYGARSLSELNLRVKMKIGINFGRHFEIEVFTDVTVIEMKTTLGDKFQLDASNINLRSNNKFLQDNDKIVECSTDGIPTFVMTATIFITINNLDESFNVEILSDATVRDLKEKISKEKNISLENFDLHLNGNNLSNENRLHEYGIENKSTVNMKTKIKILFTFEGKDESMELWSDSTILDMTHGLIERHKIQEGQIFVFFNNIVLSNKENILKYKGNVTSKLLCRKKLNIKVNFKDQCLNFAVYSDEKVSKLMKDISEKLKVKEDIIEIKLHRIVLKGSKFFYQIECQGWEVTLLTKMKIQVTFGQKRENFDCSSDYGILELKKLLAEKFNITIERIDLKAGDKELDDRKQIGTYGLNELNLMMKQNMLILVKDGEKSFSVYIQPNATGLYLKNIVKTKTGYEIDRLQLECEGELVNDHDMLQKQNIEENSILTIVSTLDGGRNCQISINLEF